MELVCYVIMGFFPALVILSMVSHARKHVGSARGHVQWGWDAPGGWHGPACRQLVMDEVIIKDDVVPLRFGCPARTACARGRFQRSCSPCSIVLRASEQS